MNVFLPYILPQKTKRPTTLKKKNTENQKTFPAFCYFTFLEREEHLGRRCSSVMVIAAGKRWSVHLLWAQLGRVGDGWLDLHQAAMELSPGAAESSVTLGRLCNLSGPLLSSLYLLMSFNYTSENQWPFQFQTHCWALGKMEKMWSLMSNSLW